MPCLLSHHSLSQTPRSPGSPFRRSEELCSCGGDGFFVFPPGSSSRISASSSRFLQVFVSRSAEISPIRKELLVSDSDACFHGGGDGIRVCSSMKMPPIDAVLRRIGDLPGGDRFQDLLLRRGENHHLCISDFNEILLTVVRFLDLDSAAVLFSNLSAFGLSPNCWSFSIMIHHLCKEQAPERAKLFLEEMIHGGFRPSVASFNFVLHSLCKKGRLQSAFEIFETMSRINCRPSIQTYNCLLNGLCYVGRIEEALRVLEQIKNSPNLKPDIFTFTTVMDGFCKVGRTDEAIELLNEALESGINPNIVTFNALINGFCREGRSMEAAVLLEQIRTIEGCDPDLITYSTLLLGLLRSGEIREALRIHAEMEKLGFHVEGRVVNSMVRRICRESRSDPDLLDDLSRILKLMREAGRRISTYTRSLVLGAFVHGGRTKEAMEQLREMERRGDLDSAKKTMEKTISEMNRRGRFLDACSVYALATKRGVSLQQKPMKLGRN